MKYNSEEKKKIITFLERAIDFVKDGDICEYKDMTNQYHLLFEVKPKTPYEIGQQVSS